MIKFLMILLIVLCMLILFFLLVYIMKFLTSKSKQAAYVVECGFDSVVSSHMPFSIQFFKISIIFLLFDVELVLIMPFLLGLGGYFFYSMMLLIYFLLLLGGGLFYEWLIKILEWE